MTDQQQSRALAVDPITAELINLGDATTTELADVVERARTVMDEITAFRQRAIDEIARRMDRSNTRTARVGNLVIETNAPSTDTYNVEALRAALHHLAEVDLIDASVLDRVIFTPAPKPPFPRVAKAELNKLQKHSDPAVAEAIETARTREPQRRTIQIRHAGNGA